MKPKKSRPRNAVVQESTTISLRIQPRASKNEIIAMEGGAFKVRLTAPPVDGAANEALVKFLADLAGVSKSQVEIVSGHTGREKIVRLNGVGPVELDRLLKAKGK